MPGTKDTEMEYISATKLYGAGIALAPLFFMKNLIKLLIQKIILEIQIKKIQLEILLFKKKRTVPNLPNPIGIVVHCGAGDWDFEQVNRSHTNRWGKISSLGFGIGYHYFIEYQGKVFQGRRDNEEGAHAIQYIPYYKPYFYNTHYVGVCLQGWGEKDTTINQLIGLKKLLNTLKEKYNILNVKIIGHRKIANKLCPGNYVYQWLVENYPD